MVDTEESTCDSDSRGKSKSLTFVLLLKERLIYPVLVSNTKVLSNLDYVATSN